MIDFTIQTYNSLIEALSKQGFSFQTLLQFIAAPEKRVIILRHDMGDHYEEVARCAVRGLRHMVKKRLRDKENYLEGRS